MNYTIELNDCILLGSGAEGSVFLTPEGFAIKQFNTIKAAKKEVSILDDVKDSPFFPNVLIRVSNIVVREYVQGENLYEYIQKKGLSYSLSREIIDLIEDLKRLNFKRLNVRNAHIFIDSNEKISFYVKLMNELINEINIQKEETLKSANNMKLITESSSANTEEVLAATEEQTASAETLEQNSNQLSDTVKSLSDSLSTFII